MNVRLLDLVSGLSGALDLISPAVVGHHRRVSAMAASLGGRLGLPLPERTDLRLAGLLHDVGAFSLKRRLDALLFDTANIDHAEVGWRLLRSAPLLERAARVVRWHHTGVEDFEQAPDEPRNLFLGNVLNLADRVDVHLRRDKDLEVQARSALRAIRMLETKTFDPEGVRALADTFSPHGLDQGFWREAGMEGVCRLDCSEAVLENGQILDFSRTFSQVIDFRSRFTATHSRGVAAVARILAELDGFPAEDQDRILLAGDLHDLGKLAVPSEILEKPGALTAEEVRIIRGHAEIGERVLSGVPGLEDVALYAGHHHVRPNGTGYPLGLGGDQLHGPRCWWPRPTCSRPWRGSAYRRQWTRTSRGTCSRRWPTWATWTVTPCACCCPSRAHRRGAPRAQDGGRREFAAFTS
jgi:HD-GYP domain-containing protein (c-di-GMP phosphodiesterase class II)